MATEQILFEFEVKGGDAALQEAANLGRAIRDNRAAIKELSKDYEANAEEVEFLVAENKKLTAEQRNLSKSAGAVSGSYNDLSVQMAELKRRQKEVNVTTAQGQKQYQEYGRRINDINNKLKALDETNGVHTRNVGNYSNSIKDAASNLNIMGVNVGQVSNQFSQASNVVRGASQAIGGANKMLKLLRLAIIGTGIGALVLAVISLITYFSKTQEGGEKLRVMFKQVGQVLNVLIERLGVFGEGLLKVFAGNFTEGVELLKEAFKGFGDEVQREVALISELEKRLIKIEKAESLLNIVRSASRARIKELNKLAEDTTKTYQQRADAAREAINLEQDLLNAQIALQKDRLANFLGEVNAGEKVNEVLGLIQQGYNGVEDAATKVDQVISMIGLDPSTFEDFQQLESILTGFYDTQLQSLELQTTLQNKLNTIEQQRVANEQKSGVAGVIKRRTVNIAEELAVTEDLTEATANFEVVAVKAYANTNTAADEFKATLIETGRAGVMAFEGIGFALGELVTNGQLSMQNFKKVMLLGLLDTLKGMIPVLTAQITGISLAQPDAVATFGASSVARVALLNGLLLGAVQGAEAYVNSTFAKGGLTDGGMFEGASHANGGIKFKVGGKIHEAEGGEAIINKRSTRMFKPVLSAINAAGGGVKFATGGMTPSMSNIINQTLESDQLARMEKAMMMQKTVLPIPVATATQRDIQVVETNSTL